MLRLIKHDLASGRRCSEQASCREERAHVGARVGYSENIRPASALDKIPDDTSIALVQYVIDQRRCRKVKLVSKSSRLCLSIQLSFAQEGPAVSRNLFSPEEG